MTKDQQAEILDDLVAGLHQHLKEKLPDVPGTWDGHELRRWIADTARDHFCWGTCLVGKRLREYQNDLITRNL